MTHPLPTGHDTPRPALSWLILTVAFALCACGGGAAETSDPAAADTTGLAAAANEADAVQAVLAAGAADVPPPLNRAEAPDIRLLAAQAQTLDLMVDAESTP